MADTEDNQIQLAIRVPKSLYAVILNRQKRAKKLSGFEPSVSEVARAMLAESAERDK
jgi:hypothetical protein